MPIAGQLAGAGLVADPTVWVEAGPRGAAPRRVVPCRRIGVDYAGAWARRRLRYYIAGNPHVSRR